MATRKANRKRKGSRRGKRRNTATVKQTTALAPYRKTNPKRRRRSHVRRARRNPATRRRNPGQGLNIAGIQVMPVVAGIASGMLTQAVSNAIPIGTPGSVGELVKEGALVFLVAKFWPLSFYRPAAVVGAAVVPGISLVNSFFPGVQSSIGGLLQKFIPAGSTSTSSQQTGVAGAAVY